MDKPTGRGGKRPGAGRKLKGDTPLDTRVQISVPAETHGLLTHFAGEAGVTVQDYIRTVLNRHIGERLIV